MPFTLAPVQALVDLLTAEGFTADQDPAKLTSLPGVWVTLDRTLPLTIGGEWSLECSLYIITRETDHRRAYESLAGQVTQLLEAGVRPDGPVVPQAVVMPGSPTPLPALRFPIHITSDWNGA